jgi:hypothetical protein
VTANQLVLVEPVEYINESFSLAVVILNNFYFQEFLIKGLDIARIHGYHLEVQSLEKRLSLLEKCLPRVSLCLPPEDTSHHADQSSTADSELDVFCSGTE